MTSAQPTRDFNSLPKELRMMIWDAAVRDNLPAAHFFSISGRYNHLDVDDDCVVFGFNDGPAREKPRVPRHRISVPTAGRKEGELCSSTANNPSTYLQDGGLWTACQESRAAIKRSQKERDWAVATCRPRRLDDCYTVNNPKSMSGYFNNNGVRQYFAIGLNDLVCFQPVDFDRFAFGDDQPFFDSPCWEPIYPQHFAFEFDPNAIYPENVPRHEFCWTQGGYIGCIANAAIWEGFHIWLIDYGIQRDTSFPNNSDIRDNRQVFYGSACRYVEVQASDPEWDYPRLEGSKLPGRETALYFAEELDERLKDYDRLNDYDFDLYSNAVSEEIETRKGATLGVLACEYKR